MPSFTVPDPLTRGVPGTVTVSMPGLGQAGTATWDAPATVLDDGYRGGHWVVYIDDQYAGLDPDGTPVSGRTTGYSIGYTGTAPAPICASIARRVGSDRA